MQSHRALQVFCATAALALVCANPAYARGGHSKTGGSTVTPCGDGTLTVSPITLWPPNHKMQTITLVFSEVEAKPDRDTLTLTVNSITDNQVETNGEGCGPPSSKQGPDVVFDTTPVSTMDPSFPSENTSPFARASSRPSRTCSEEWLSRRRRKTLMR